MTTAQKSIVIAALAAAVGTGFFAVHQSTELNSRIRALQLDQAPLTARLHDLEREHSQVATQLAALSEENARLKSGQNDAELLRLRGQVGVLRQQAATSQNKAATPPGGIIGMMNDPAMRDYLQQSIKEKMGSLYGDLLTELKLTPEQRDQFIKVMSSAATQGMSQLADKAQGSTNQGPDPYAAIGKELYVLLGADGINRFKDYTTELPGRSVLTMLNGQPGMTALTSEQSASLIKVFKGEPKDLVQGLLGGPDTAFLGSQADIDNFLQQVAESNQRVVEQAGNFLSPDQVTVLDRVLTENIERRKLQGAAYFPKR